MVRPVLVQPVFPIPEIPKPEIFTRDIVNNFHTDELEREMAQLLRDLGDRFLVWTIIPTKFVDWIEEYDREFGERSIANRRALYAALVRGAAIYNAHPRRDITLRTSTNI